MSSPGMCSRLSELIGAVTLFHDIGCLLRGHALRIPEVINQ